MAKGIFRFSKVFMAMPCGGQGKSIDGRKVGWILDNDHPHLFSFLEVVGAMTENPVAVGHEKHDSSRI
jgi:hypothetical protein